MMPPMLRLPDPAAATTDGSNSVTSGRAPRLRPSRK
jgi:hypothetical protein